MGESRQELVAWLNNLLQLNLTKVEQCGTGAPLCQIMDSIYLDVPMSRVKFNANTEYMYLQNFKVLTNCLTKHGVERPVPVESLIKCKMQDNLEFLQWIKKYWDQNYPGGEYDALGRRKASGASPAARAGSAGGVRRGTTPSSVGRAGGLSATRAPSAAATQAQIREATASLHEEIATQKEAIAGLEKERDFYFAKLRDIELLLQQALEAEPELENQEDS
ncbi:hypothetical protein KEM56_004661, partial [Ascosphaera pollenicola]